MTTRVATARRPPLSKTKQTPHIQAHDLERRGSHGAGAPACAAWARPELVDPSVGAIVVAANGEVVARGWTAPGGRPHAEAIALERAGAKAKGHPLCHARTLRPPRGQGAPCAEIIAAAKPARAVIALRDPDPRTSGRGIERLAASGIEVEDGVLAEEAKAVTLGHILRVTEERPAVTLKLAVGADGLVPQGRARRCGSRGPMRAHMAISSEPGTTRSWSAAARSSPTTRA